MPAGFTPTPMPLFLEGPVRWLKLNRPQEEKRALVYKIQESPLYDTSLGMYKVNASLENTTYEAGRARAFTPGWLENESIWLHMEYKYLLELLKSELYDEFTAAFHKAAVPFLDSEIYGRSILENSSFIASGANPNPACRGRGFVARLSGSTAEFLQMWQILFFGKAPFYMDKDNLMLRFTPFVPEYLMPSDGMVEAVFLGSIRVRYHAPGKRALVPGQYTVKEYRLVQEEGETVFEGSVLAGAAALSVRDRLVKSIDIFLG